MHYLSIIVPYISYQVIFFFFFFSSRRRHTRCLSDWSSDVCSSDLMTLSFTSPCRFRPAHKEHSDGHPDEHNGSTVDRSEERRVGKECRSGWWEYDKEKKE